MLTNHEEKEYNKEIAKAREEEKNFLSKHEKEFKYSITVGHWGNKKSLNDINQKIQKAIEYFAEKGVKQEDISIYGSNDYNGDFKDFSLGFIGKRLETDDEHYRRTKDYKGNAIIKLEKAAALIEFRKLKAINYLTSLGYKVEKK